MSKKPQAQEVRDYVQQRAAALGLNPAPVIGLIEEMSSYNPKRTGKHVGLFGVRREEIKDVPAYLRDWKGQVNMGLLMLATHKKKSGTDIGALAEFLGASESDQGYVRKAIRAYGRGGKYGGEVLDEEAINMTYQAFGAQGDAAADIRAMGTGNRASTAKAPTGSRAEQNAAYADNPNVSRYLDMIAAAEGVKHGYGTLFGNKEFTDFSKHPNVRQSFTQTDGKKNVTTAAGKFQFIKPTWDGLAKKLNLKDFSPRSQDIAAVELLRQNGSLNDVLAGNYDTAVQKDGKTWASLPSSNYAQPKRSMDFVQKHLGSPVAPSTGKATQAAASIQPSQPAPQQPIAEQSQQQGMWDDGLLDSAMDDMVSDLMRSEEEKQERKQRRDTLDERLNAVFEVDGFTFGDEGLTAKVSSFVDMVAKGDL